MQPKVGKEVTVTFSLPPSPPLLETQKDNTALEHQVLSQLKPDWTPIEILARLCVSVLMHAQDQDATKRLSTGPGITHQGIKHVSDIHQAVSAISSHGFATPPMSRTTSELDEFVDVVLSTPKMEELIPQGTKRVLEETEMGPEKRIAMDC